MTIETASVRPAVALRANPRAGAAEAERSVVVLTTAAEIDAFRPQWEALRPGPRADPDSFLAVVRSRPAIVRPHVFVMLCGATVEALLVARLEDHDFGCRVGDRLVRAGRVPALAIDHGGALALSPRTPWGPVVAAVSGALARGVAAAAHFRCLGEDSPLLAAIRGRVPRIWRNESEAPALHWSVGLPATYDAFLGRTGGHARKSIRRDRRALEREFPGTVVVRRTTDAADVPGFCRRAESVARTTYQRGLGAGFVHDAEYEARLTVSARRGRLRAYELVAGGAVLSFWIGELHEGTHFVDSTGYDAAFARWSPGKALRLEVTRDLIAEGATRMDFGFGDAEYKRQFGAESHLERDVYLLAPGARGVWLNAVRSGLTFAAGAARRVAVRARITDALRRVRRRRAVSRLAAAATPSYAEEAAG